jgi:dTDP-glucose 4,6-dehydratase
MRPNDGRIVPSLMMQALQDEPLTVFGDGSQTRSFCFVSDLIEGIYRLLLSDAKDPVNIGNPSELTVMQFAETIKEITGTSAPIVHRPLPTDDPKQRRPDITVAKAKLGWEPKVGLREGLIETVGYFRGIVEERRAKG